MGKIINLVFKSYIILLLICVLHVQSAFAAPGTLTGKLTQTEEKPLSGYTIELYNAEYNFSDVTNRQGRFGFEDIPIGTYNLVIWTPGKKLLGNTIPYRTVVLTQKNPTEEIYITVSVQIIPNPEPPDDDDDDVVEKSGSIRGNVVDTAGNKLQGYKVILRDEKKGFNREDITDSYGRFEFINLKLGGYYLDVVCPNGKVARRDIVANLFEDSTKYRIGGITVTDNACDEDADDNGPPSGDTGNIEIQIKTEKPEKQSFSVELRGDEGAKFKKWTDSNGYVLFTKIPYGKYRVWVFDPNFILLNNTEDVVITKYVPFDSVTVDVKFSDEKPDNIIEAKKKGKGRVDVVLLNRELNARYLVVLNDGSNPKFHRWTGTAGAVSFNDIPYGTYELSVFGEDRRQLKSGINVSISELFPTDSKEVDLDITPSVEETEVTIFATYNGDPIPNAIVQIFQNETQQAQKLTNTQGKATFQLTPGETYLAKVLGERGYELISEKEFTLDPKDTKKTIHVNYGNDPNTPPTEEIDVTLNFYSDWEAQKRLSGTHRIELSGKYETYTTMLTNGIARMDVFPDRYKIKVYNSNNGLIYENSITINQNNDTFEFVIVKDSDNNGNSDDDDKDGKGIFEGTIKSEGEKELYRLELVRLDKNDVIRGWCDEQGNFSFTELPMGTYELRIYSSKTQKLLSRNTTFTLSDLFPRFYKDIKLGKNASEKKTGIIEGRVIRAGADKNLFRIKLHNQKDEFYRWTDEEGNFRFDGVPFGTYTMEIYSFPENELIMGGISVTISPTIYLATRHIELPENWEPKKKEAKKDDDDKKGKVILQVIKPDEENKQYFVVLVDKTPVFKGYTGPDGHITFEGVPYGSYTVQVFSADNQQLLRNEDALNFSGLFDPHRMTIKIPETPKEKKGTLDIHVTRKDGEQERFHVVLYDAVKGTKTKFNSFTNSDGFVLFDEIPLGSYQIHVFTESNEFLTQENVVTLTELFPKKSIKIEIPKSDEKKKKEEEEKDKIGSINITVNDENCKDCIRRVILFDALTGESTEFNGWTNREGFIAFEKVPIGSYNIRVYSPAGKLLKEGEIVTLSKHFPSYSIEIKIEKDKPDPPKNTGTFDGKIIDDKQKIYRVKLLDNNKKEYFRWSNQYGYFRFDELPYGVYNFKIFSSPEQSLIYEDVIEISELFPNVFEEITLKKKENADKKKGTITGKVVNKYKPNQIYHIGIIDKGELKNTIKTNTDGEFLISGLDYGTYELNVYSNINDRPAELLKDGISVTLSPYIPYIFRKIDLTNPADNKGTVTGKVVKEDAKGEEQNFKVVLKSGGATTVIETEKNGDFSKAGIPFGNYSVEIYNENGKLKKEDMDPIQLTNNFPVYDFGTIKIKKEKEKVKGTLIGQVTYLKTAEHTPKAKIVLRDVSGEIKKDTETNDLGDFEIGDIDLGTYWINAYSLEKGKEGEPLKDDEDKPIEIKVTFDKLFPNKYVEIKVGEKPAPESNKIKLVVINPEKGDTLQYVAQLIALTEPDKIVETKHPLNRQVIEFSGLKLGVYQLKILVPSEPPLADLDELVQSGEQAKLLNPECLMLELTKQNPAKLVSLQYESPKDDDEEIWSYRRYDYSGTDKKKDDKDKVWKCKQWVIIP